MSRFIDHFKAEIFSEAFTKVFFSGPKGRLVAFFFAMAYVLLRTFWIIARIGCLVVIWGISKISRKTFGSSYFSNLRTLSALRSIARTFGDTCEKSENGDWTSYVISGDGFRSGRFELELRSHSKCRAIRVLVSAGTERFELENEVVSAFSGREESFATTEGLPNIYKRLRTHFL